MDVYRRPAGSEEPWKITGETICPGGPESTEAAPESEQSVELTLHAFQQLPIPASDIELPLEFDGWGATMVNQHTPIWASSEIRSLSTTILGEEVQVKAVPIRYEWDYGDGQTRSLNVPGEPWHGEEFPERSTPWSVEYDATGNYRVNLTTVYSGSFRVGDGPWTPVEGFAAVPSQERPMSVWKAEARLVSGDCAENPNAWACDGTEAKTWLITPPWELPSGQVRWGPAENQSGD